MKRRTFMAILGGAVGSLMFLQAQGALAVESTAVGGVDSEFFVNGMDLTKHIEDWEPTDPLPVANTG